MSRLASSLHSPWRTADLRPLSFDLPASNFQLRLYNSFVFSRRVFAFRSPISSYLISDPPMDGFAVANRCPPWLAVGRRGDRRRLTSEKRGRSRGFTVKQRERSRAFTLLELLVVIGIISILLVAVIPAVTSLSKSSGRKGAISNLLGAIEQARAEAIKTGQSTYVVFPTFGSGTSQTTLDRYNYKSFAIWEDDPSTTPASQKQLTKWQTLPTGIAIRAAGSAPLSGLADPATLTPPVTSLTFTPDSKATPVFLCVKFNTNGEVESPVNNVTLTVFEGYVNGGTEVMTSAKDANGDPASQESLAIARLTGRAEHLVPTPAP